MFGRIKNIIFLLIIFFLSSQVGFHFWPDFAYVNGVRIDYLSPTLHLLDILIVGFILFSVPEFKRLLRPPDLIGVPRNDRLRNVLLSLFVLDLAINIFIVKSPTAHIFGIIKLIEFVLFGMSVSLFFKKEHIKSFVRVLSFSAIVSSVLAIWQFVNQASVGGLWYWFGERTFNISTIGISTVNLNQQLLRSYAAFPHPNVLAFFLLTSIVFATGRFAHEKKHSEKMFLVFTIVLSSAALLTTFSRITIFLALCFFLYAIYTKAKSKARYFTFGFLQIVLPAVIIFPLASSSSFLFRGLDFRQELFVQSFKIFTASPYFGIGLNNFFAAQLPLIKTISPINFQPVHNIFVLALLSLGLFGFWIVPYIFVLALRSVSAKLRTTNYELRTFHQGVLFLLFGIIIVGMFDHFFLTLEQGQLILALIIGLTFTSM